MEKKKLDGILVEGYGVIGKAFMKDTRLSIEAKSIFTYLTTFTSRDNNKACPSVENQCHYLRMSETRYYKHRKMLEENGYITISQKREIRMCIDGRKRHQVVHNIYTLYGNAEDLKKNSLAYKEKQLEKKAPKSTKNKDSKDNSGDDNTPSSSLVPSDFVIHQDVKEPDETKQNEGSNNPSFNNPSSNNPSTINSSSIEEVVNQENAETKKSDDEEELNDLMKFCNKNNFKLKRSAAKEFLAAHSFDFICKAIIRCITGAKEPIRSARHYLSTTIANILSTTNKLEIVMPDSPKKPSTFANFTQREYDYNKLEKQLLGWDDEYEDDEVQDEPEKATKVNGEELLAKIRGKHDGVEVKENNEYEEGFENFLKEKGCVDAVGIDLIILRDEYIKDKHYGKIIY